MADLHFYEKGHIYMLGDRRVPCVSDLCRFLSREIYRDAPPWQLEAAAARGTAVHTATQVLDEEGAAQIEADYSPYLQAYAAFLRDYAPRWQLIEKSFYHPTDDYAGTIDRYGLINGKRTLVDIKNTYTVYKPLCSASLNFYRRLLEANGYDVDQLEILHLKKDGRYQLIPFAVDDTVPQSLLTLHRALRKRRKGEKYV